MGMYMNDFLASDIIHPSSSRAGAGFLFVEKNKTLRLCTDDWGLIINHYPLPFVSSAFELLYFSALFTNLHNAYHLVNIQEGEEWKTAFNTPTRHYKHLVMHFNKHLSTCLFIPPTFRSQVLLQYAYAQKLTCHPGVQRTWDVLQYFL